ncbi:MAG TPA: ABC transporter permease [Bryobacteraceae bacterium]|nr:ABC transporter permease [Bryobacteraceae bacterium]
MKDFQYALRTLLKSKAFTAIAVLTMAVGIAANTTVFSWIDGVILNPFPGVSRPADLVALETVAPSGEHLTTSYPDYRDVRDGAKLFDGIMVSQPRPLNVGEGVRAQRVWGELVSGNYFDVMGVKPALGRFFIGQERDDSPGGHLVAVVSHAFWKNRLHADPAAVGSTIRINRYPFTIIGVAPENFGGSMSTLAFDLWAPAMTFGELTAAGDFYVGDRQTRMFLSLARLKPGIRIEQGRAELRSLAQRLAETYANTNRGMGITIVPVSRAAFGAQKTMLAPLSILMGICGVVLLIACANVTNLLLARATARAKEFSVRLALGAPRFRLVRQLLVETLLLAFAGSLLGLAFADQMRSALIWLIPATTTPTLAKPPLDWRALLFTEALAVAVTLIAGLIPAWQATDLDSSDALKEAGRGGSGGARSHRLRGALVVAEVALAVVTLVGAGLFMKSFQLAKTINPGFDPQHVAIAEIELSTAGYNAAQAGIFCRRLRRDLESQPGVTAVSFADNIPLGFVGAAWEDLQVEGYVPGPTENMKIYRTMVAPGYFDLMRIPLLDGRDFAERDDDKSLPVMIVNQEFVRRFLPRRNPIGNKVHGWGKWFTIVGLVRDAKYMSYTESPQPYFYIPIRQIYRPEMGLKFYLRTAGAPEPAVKMIRQAAAAVDPNVAMFGGESLSIHIGAALFGQKVAASLLSALGLIALVLSAVGLYSVMSYSIVQRTHEIGIRIALGARPLDVTWLALSRGMVLAGAGLAIGLFAAAALARTASSALVKVSPADPAVYAAVAAFLGLIAALASWIPARRAARVDPIESLRVQ